MNAEASALPGLSRQLHRQLRQFYDDEVAACIRGKY
jgi:hypothetical protein